jgi:hypothetical protein
VCLDSNFIWLCFYVPPPCKLKKYNDQLQVLFVYETKFKGDHDLKTMKSCGVHLVRRCEEKAKDSKGGIQVTERPGDDDNFQSNLYPPQQKRHSSTLGIRISDTEAEAEAL